MNTDNSVLLCPPVHPHVRGDNSTRRRLPFLRYGSPPRAWGQYQHRRHRARHNRFTPTCVGTMAENESQLKSYAVHPHVRGDNAAKTGNASDPGGSPPRAWGQCDRPLLRHRFPRFTPTCVGTIVLSSFVSKSTTVHPHVRGDNVKVFAAMPCRVGSPPRAWGQ